VFVAGGTGVIGARTVQQLIASGHRVTAIARSPEKAGLLESWGAAAARIDLFDPEAVVAAVDGHDAVVNVATHIPKTSKAALPGAWKENDRIRTEGSRNLVDAALKAGARTYVQEAVTFAYEDAGEEWITEDHPLRMVPYTQSIVDAQTETERFTQAGGAGVHLRFGMFYAADSHHTVDQVQWARRGVSMEVGDLASYKSMIHADDAASAVVAALEVPAGVYNVADDDPLTRGEHVELTAELVGRTKLRRGLHRVRHLAGSKVEILARSQRISNRRFREASGWAPRYRDVRAGFPEVFAEIEHREVA
jgi:nucleoside-diphosphate-sugar epimerase